MNVTSTANNDWYKGQDCGRVAGLYRYNPATRPQSSLLLMKRSIFSVNMLHTTLIISFLEIFQDTISIIYQFGIV